MKKQFYDECFGSTEVMTAWAKAEDLDIVYDEDGNPDWGAVYEQYLKKINSPEYMAALAKRENIEITYKEDGSPDWDDVYLKHLNKLLERSKKQ